MKKLIAAIIAGGALVLSPVVASAQTYVTIYAANPGRTSDFCDRYARDWANWATDRGHDAAVGGIIGGTFGTFIGAAAGRPGLGGLIGGGIGLLAGAYADRPQWEAEYQRAWQQCINGGPLAYPWMYDFSGGRYVAGSPEWYNWCSQTYGPYFDPSTGKYLASDGQRYPCVVP